MQTTASSSPHDIVADINYFPSTGRPIETKEWKTRYLGVRDDHTREMTIHDIRGQEQKFNLDQNGFQFISFPEKRRETREDGVIMKEYYPELEELARKITGASTAHVFNHVLRKFSAPSVRGTQEADGRWKEIPSGHPHVDYCGIPELMEGTKKEIALPPNIGVFFDTSSRFSFLGTWRPLKALMKDPLAVADSMTVPDSDFQLRERLFRSGIRSGNYVMSHGSVKEQHHWYYMHEMQPHELVIFKGYDSKQDLPGWRCPHTAFKIPGTEDLPPRESIECRIVCFWD